MTVQVRIAAIVIILFLGTLGFWWWGLNDYRTTTAMVASLRVEMEKMKAHVQETERVLNAVDSLKSAILQGRAATDAALEESQRYIGNERLDRLERLLQEDLARRAGNNAAGGAAGGVPGAEGRGTGATATQRGGH